MTDGVFIDRSFKHTPTWAVVWNDVLLPGRFGTELEARTHLYGLVSGTPRRSPRLDGTDAPVGVSLNHEAMT